MTSFFNKKILQLMIQEKIDLRNYLIKPTAELYEKVKHMRVLNTKTWRPELLKPRHLN